MGAAMTDALPRSRAKRVADASTARCPRPMRARDRAPFSPLARVCAALPAAAVGTAVTRGRLRPGWCPGTRAIAGRSRFVLIYQYTKDESIGDHSRLRLTFVEEFALWPREMGRTQRSRRQEFRPIMAMGQGAFLLWWQLEPLR